MKLKLKNNIVEDNEMWNKSYLTEFAFYIGTNNYMDKIIKEKLIDNVDTSGMIVFCMYVEFMVERFKDSMCRSLYEYIDNYFEEDLVDFINEYFEVIE